MKKKILSLLLAFVMCMMPFGVAFASGGATNVPDITITPPTGGGATGLSGIAGKIIGAMQFIGYVVAVIMIIYVGIKYLTAGAGEKANVKSTLVPMLGGALLIIFGMTIVNWVWGMQ